MLNWHVVMCKERGIPGSEIEINPQDHCILPQTIDAKVTHFASKRACMQTKKRKNAIASKIALTSQLAASWKQLRPLPTLTLIQRSRPITPVFTPQNTLIRHLP